MTINGTSIDHLQNHLLTIYQSSSKTIYQLTKGVLSVLRIAGYHGELTHMQSRFPLSARPLPNAALHLGKPNKIEPKSGWKSKKWVFNSSLSLPMKKGSNSGHLKMPIIFVDGPHQTFMMFHGVFQDGAATLPLCQATIHQETRANEMPVAKPAALGSDSYHITTIQCSTAEKFRKALENSSKLWISCHYGHAWTAKFRKTLEYLSYGHWTCISVSLKTDQNSSTDDGRPQAMQPNLERQPVAQRGNPQTGVAF